MEPVRVGRASMLDGRVAFNRRFVMRDGTAEMMGGKRKEEILYREGPSDPEVGVVCLVNESLKTVAMILHHTCHPVHGYPQRYISAGWPGAWCVEVRKRFAPDAVCLVLNGCCGNVIHRDALDPAQVDEPGRMGSLLAETTGRALRAIRCEEDPTLDCRIARIPIPLRKADPDELTEARAILEKHPEPMWLDETHTLTDRAWCYAVGRVDLDELRRREPAYDYEVQAFRIGSLALVALIGEPFVEGQLRIKMESPADRTYVAHMSNGYVGYIPTPEALRRGGYETRTAYWSKLVPEALDMIVAETGRTLAALFA